MDEPTGTETPGAESEAEAQSEETLLPWIFGGLGILLIAMFAAWLTLGQRAHIREPPGAAPANPNAHPHYFSSGGG